MFHFTQLYIYTIYTIIQVDNNVKYSYVILPRNLN